MPFYFQHLPLSHSFSKLLFPTLASLTYRISHFTYPARRENPHIPLTGLLANQLSNKDGCVTQSTAPTCAPSPTYALPPTLMPNTTSRSLPSTLFLIPTPTLPQ